MSKGALRLGWTSRAPWPTVPCRSRAATEPGAGRVPRPARRRRGRAPGRHPAHPHLGEVHLTTDGAAGRPAGADERHPRRCDGMARRADDPGRRPRRRRRHGGRARSGGRPGDERGGDGHGDRRSAGRLDAGDVSRGQALCDAHAAVTGEPARLGGVPGATDGTVLTARTGMPTVVYGPGGKWIAHQVDEFVDVPRSSKRPRSTARPPSASWRTQTADGCGGCAVGDGRAPQRPDRRRGPAGRPRGAWAGDGGPGRR